MVRVKMAALISVNPIAETISQRTSAGRYSPACSTTFKTAAPTEAIAIVKRKCR
jgi:hypothetical protein